MSKHSAAKPQGGTVDVVLWCQICDAESYATSLPDREHDVTGYTLPTPWRLVSLADSVYHTTRHFLACSEPCELTLRGKR